MEKEACSLLKTLLPHCSEETKDILPLSFENSIFSLVSVALLFASGFSRRSQKYILEPLFTETSGLRLEINVLPGEVTKVESHNYLIKMNCKKDFQGC